MVGEREPLANQQVCQGQLCVVEEQASSDNRELVDVPIRDSPVGDFVRRPFGTNRNDVETTTAKAMETPRVSLSVPLE